LCLAAILEAFSQPSFFVWFNQIPKDEDLSQQSAAEALVSVSQSQGSQSGLALLAQQAQSGSSSSRPASNGAPSTTSSSHQTFSNPSPSSIARQNASPGRGHKRKSVASDEDHDQIDDSGESLFSEETTSAHSMGGVRDHPASSHQHPNSQTSARTSLPPMSVQLANQPSTSSSSSSHPVAHSSSWNPSNAPQHLAHSTSHRSNGDEFLQLPPINQGPPFPNSIWNSSSSSSPNHQGAVALNPNERRTSPFPPSSSYQQQPTNPIPPIHSSSRPNDSSNSSASSRLPSLSTSLFPSTSSPSSSRPLLSQADLEDYRRELLAGRQWLEGMLEKTSAGLKQVDEEMRRGRGGEGRDVDQAQALPMARTASSSVERTRESIWGLDRGPGQ